MQGSNSSGDKSREILKDVFLLPSPKAYKVPRRKEREELCSNGFVSFAVPFNTSLTEPEIIRQITLEFAEKFSECNLPSFEFLKAVNDKLITQESKVWDGKVLKHMTGTGPLYIRSKKTIPLACQVMHSSSDSDSDNSISCIKKYCIREEKKKIPSVPYRHNQQIGQANYLKFPQALLKYSAPFARSFSIRTT